MERVRRGVYQLTPEGKNLSLTDSHTAFMNQLEEYPVYVDWRRRTSAMSPDRKVESKSSPNQEIVSRQNGDGTETPEETLDRAARQWRSALEADLLQRVRNAAPEFLERAVVDLLIAMGYGGGDATMGRVTGRSGDGGIDGKIREDPLGLDEVYVQAKKYAEGNAVGEGDLRNFAGAIDATKLNKGVFVTTASFTRAASDYVARSPKRIVLIDGAELARLMVRHGIGVRTRTLHEIKVKRIDEDYFDQEAL